MTTFDARALGVPRAIALFGIALLFGCSHPPADATADGVVRLFLDVMEGAEDDPREMRRAYDLLGPVARARLEARARHTSRLQGRQVQPWDMLATGRFGLAFRPKSMHPAVVGDRATVEVLGADPKNEHASVVCVREARGWRIEPGFPDP
ncbi:MAG: hypothetical protein M3O36_16950 [Myxococcota bacterium]|nr:hypothetical protein [Myxococcota bacterium]